MKSNVIVARHPLHPMLIPLPIAGFVFALAGDIAYVATGTPFWYSFGLWCMAFGVVTALVAAIPGFIDYFTIASRSSPEIRSHARLHMVINLSVVGLFALNLALRVFYDASVAPLLGWAIGLTVLGNALLLYSGWLGGELVYRHRIGVEERGTAAGPLFRVTLAPAIPAEEAAESRETRKP